MKQTSISAKYVHMLCTLFSYCCLLCCSKCYVWSPFCEISLCGLQGWCLREKNKPGSYQRSTLWMGLEMLEGGVSHTCCPNVKSTASFVFLNTQHCTYTHTFLHRKFEDVYEICYWKRENTGTRTVLERDRGRQNETGRWETENWSAIV